MNKAFKKYGKASFRSTRLVRERQRRAWRTIRAHQAAMIGYSQLALIRNTTTPYKAFKSMAMAQCALATTQAISIIMQGRV